MRKIFRPFLSLFILLSPTLVLADNYSALLKEWDGNLSAIDLCQGHNLTITENAYKEGKGACIGDSRKDLCRAWKQGASDWPSLTGSDDHAGVMLMMVAREITATGARFCPTQLEAQRGKLSAFTTYKDASGDDPNSCIWLCKDGFFGDSCKIPINGAEKCFYENNTILKAENYDGIQIVSGGTNIENDIPAFYRNTGYSCVHKQGRNEEHDLILVITGWEPHGAFVQPVFFRAARNNVNDKMKSASVVYEEYPDKPVHVCLSGYALEGDTCQKISLCRDEQPNPAPVIDGNSDDDDTTCDMIGYGFDSENRCVKCTGSAGRFGITSERKCIRCDNDMLFDKKAEKCVSQRVVTKHEMLYGNGVLVNGKRCWELAGTDNTYKDCVLGEQ